MSLIPTNPLNLAALIAIGIMLLTLYTGIGSVVLMVMDGNGRYRAVMKRWATWQEYFALAIWPLSVLYVLRRADRRGRPF